MAPQKNTSFPLNIPYVPSSNLNQLIEKDILDRIECKKQNIETRYRKIIKTGNCFAIFFLPLIERLIELVSFLRLPYCFHQRCHHLIRSASLFGLRNNDEKS